MSNDISKALKNKTDAQFRLFEQDAAPIVRESVSGDNFIADPNEYSQGLLAGKNITITIAGNDKTINAVMGILSGDNIIISEADEDGKVTIKGTIRGKDINIDDFVGKDGYVLSYDEIGDQFILTEASSGGAALTQATETELGGIKAKPKTTETSEIAIDTATGKLFAPASDGGGGGVPDGGLKDQIIKKNSSADGDVFWSDPPIILNSPGGFDIENFEGDTYKFTTNILSGWVKTSGGYNSLYCLSNLYDTLPADVRFTVNLLTAGKLTFYYKSRMQLANYPQYSGHTLSIDGITKKVYTANVTSFTKEEIDISAGMHEIRLYKHALSHSSHFWIDDLTLPGNGQFDMDAAFQNPNKLLKVSSSGTSIGFMAMSGDVLPTASSDLRGQIFTLQGGAGVADASYICQKDASDAYVWQQI